MESAGADRWRFTCKPRAGFHHGKQTSSAILISVTFSQAEYEVRCEWGLQGLKAIGPISDVIVLVDILSFTTSIDIATARGGMIFPYPLKGESAAAYAASVHAELALAHRGEGFSLSPVSLAGLPDGHRLVLPSPNGAALAFSLDHPAVFAACLRNATAVAQVAARFGTTIGIIAAGERWPGGELRPCLEDWIGAGAVIAALSGRRSVESAAAEAVFDRFRENLLQTLRLSGSGKELIERGFGMDVDLAAELDISANVPRLVDHAFVAFH